MATLLFRDPRAFALAVMMILAMGLSAALTVGRQEDPTITNLFATVVTPYPGADPARVEALVTARIEEELRGVAEIGEIASVSRPGVSVIRIELADTLPDARIETAWTDIRNALDDAERQFPAGAGSPEFTNDRTGTYTAIFALTAAPGRPAEPAILARLAEDLADRLRTVPGTALVDLFGLPEEEIAVALDPDRLAGLGLSVGDVAQALARADAKTPAGRLRGTGTDLAVELDGAFDGLARIRAVPLVQRSDGPSVRLGDVATVARGLAEPPDSLARLDGSPAVLVAARMENDLQVDGWAARTRAVADRFAATLPGSVAQRLIFDQSRYTAARFATLGWNLAIGVALVVAVLLVTLGLRAAIVVAAALPLAGLISLFVFDRIGLSVHQMSVTGMIVALGLLVDAAIVMTDAIRVRIAAGETRLAAVGSSVRILAVPLAASTATTVLAFLPMALTPGPVGDFIGSIALAVIAMLGASFLLAVTITPAMAGWLLPDPGARPAWWRDGVAGGAMGRAFGASLRLALAYPGLAILAALVLPVAGFLALPTLTAQFFPGADRDQFHVQMTLPGGTALARTGLAVDRADAILRADPAVVSVAWVIGESAPAFYYNMTMDQDGVPGFAEALVTTRDPAATPAAIARVQRALDTGLPQAQAIVRELVQGPPVAAPVELRFVGPDLAVLRDLAERARAVVAAEPQITHARATGTDGAPKLVFALDEDALRAVGLDIARVTADLAAALDGARGGSVVEGTEELPVRVRLAAEARGRVDRVAALATLGAGAQAAMAEAGWPAVPLAALGALRLEPAGAAIHRRQGERIALVQGFPAAGVLPEEVLRSLRPRLDAALGPMLGGYRLEVGGDADARADTVTYLMATAGLVAALTVATLVLSFGSFRLTAITLVVAVLSAGLSLLALAVFRHPFGVNALIGVIGSVGVSVNAAIIILSALHEDPAARRGDRAAIAAVTIGAGRHIISTTVTTVGGFLPLILGGGGFWPPFAVAVAGGVALSTVVSFWFTPPVYALVVRLRMPRVLRVVAA